MLFRSSIPSKNEEMKEKETKNIVGLSMKGGRKDLFTFCLLEFYPDQKRWFLKSLLKVEDEVPKKDGDAAIKKWIEEYDVHQLVVDFPLTNPPCHDCTLDCPGVHQCPVAEVKAVRKSMDTILEKDQKLMESDPKKYEYDRNADDQFDHGKDILTKVAHDHMISRSFRRRLKKGFLPYWNRPVDFWIWRHYYDQLLEMFNSSYDSFGNTSLMIMARFSYLKRHFPRSLSLYEAHVPLIFLELIRSKIISRQDLYQLSDFEMGIDARFDILKKIESALGIFIYEHDMEVLIKNPRAFDSFMLACAGQRKQLQKTIEISEETIGNSRFIMPSFSE